MATSHFGSGILLSGAQISCLPLSTFTSNDTGLIRYCMCVVLILGEREKKRKAATKQRAERIHLASFSHTFSQFLLSQLICMCLPRSSAFTLRKLPSPLPHTPSSHLYSTLSPFPSPQLSPFFATVVTVLLSCSENVERPL